ncbi:MAG: hypothetical protein WD690_19505 [Vicinamibacterales bacterium]
MIRAAAAAAALALGVTSAAAQGTITRERVERRNSIRVFGNVLVNAAQLGAELLGVRVRQIDPSIILLSGTTPRAHGFLLDGHGIFFHVEIPAMNPAIEWAFRARGRDQAAEAAMINIRRRLETVTDPQERAILDRDLRSLERRLLPPGAVEQQARAVSTNGTAPSPTAAPPPVMENPNREYRQLVTEQLVNAMLEYGHQLGLAADDWLTVAARGSEGPLLPEVFNERTTLTLRIKGSDLAAFRAGSLTRDEARARIVIGEF